MDRCPRIATRPTPTLARLKPFSESPCSAVSSHGLEIGRVRQTVAANPALGRLRHKARLPGLDAAMARELSLPLVGETANLVLPRVFPGLGSFGRSLAPSTKRSERPRSTSRRSQLNACRP